MTDHILDSIHQKDSEIVFDKSFYQRVFKRTERLLHAAFYVTDKIEDKGALQIKDTVTETIITLTKDITGVLMREKSDARKPLIMCSSELLLLSSLLTLATTRGYVRESHSGLIVHEIEAVLTEINDYMHQEEKPLLRSRVPHRRVDLFIRDTASEGVISTARGESLGIVHSPEPNRQERIKDIIREKGQVGIKDISDTITDISEKSIQRDLNDMIAKGEVVRKGERRWSTYVLPHV